MIKVTGILCQKLFHPVVRKNCSGDVELLMLKAEQFSKFLRSLEQFVYLYNKRSEQFWILFCFLRGIPADVFFFSKVVRNILGIGNHLFLS